MSEQHRADVVIIGGGIMGLWARALLARAGFGVALVERSCLGDGQTIRSQGILHRGLKYGLTRSARETSDQLEESAEAWEKCLRGEGEVDLRKVRVLSPSTHFWTVDGGALLNLTTSIGVSWFVKAQSRPRELERGGFPAAFQGAPRSVRVWEVTEPVLDASSLVSGVRSAVEGGLMLGDVTFIGDHGCEEGPEVEVALHNGETARIRARCVILAAGEGNESLLKLAGLDGPAAAQRRPLHMALVDGVGFPLFGHVLRAGSDKPRITVTTGERAHSRTWYIGGDVAEKGVEQGGEEFRSAVREELQACLPWVKFDGARFSSLRVNRAEGRTASGARPGGPMLKRYGRIIAAWPTKLALAPLAAKEALREASQIVGAPSGATPSASTLAAEVCDLPWNDPQRTWEPLAGQGGA